MSIRRQVVSLVLVTVTLGVIGCGPNQPAQPTGGGGGTPPGPTGTPPTANTTPVAPPQGEAKADFTLTIPEYKTEYQKSRADTDKKYLFKWVEATGRVEGYKSRTDGFEVVIDSPDVEMFAFHCVLKDPAPWNTALPGQTVTVRGKVSLVFPVLSMEKGVIVSASGTGPATVAASQLAKEFKANQDEFREKHKIGSHLILTGEITSVETREVSDSTAITLASEANGATVTCSFSNLNPTHKERNAKLAKGQKVKVLGWNTSVTECAYTDCVLLDEKK